MAVSDKLPEIQCGNIQNKLRALEVFCPEVRTQILDRFPKDIRLRIEKTKSTQWVSVGYSIELSECVAAIVPEHTEAMREERVFRWALRASTYSIDASFVGPFMRAALNLLRIKSATVLKMCPQIWKTVHRNCGELLAFEKGPGDLEIQLKDLPPAMTQSRPYLIGVTAFIKAMLNFAGAKGHVFLREVSKDTNSAFLLVSWETVDKSQYSTVSCQTKSKALPSNIAGKIAKI